MENQVTVEDRVPNQTLDMDLDVQTVAGVQNSEYVCEDNRYFEDPVLGYQRLSGAIAEIELVVKPQKSSESRGSMVPKPDLSFTNKPEIPC